ncbi:D-Ala-D-Ala carboxypeptidase family metallohydrolase, partial [Succinivibrio sp.]|uniref:D-Ala-D-Ala carboxypeptidase family metallohydrolase n=1 Tax=Succinivibrio sp. TaxID=2053619 RepID=UPI0025E0F421
MANNTKNFKVSEFACKCGCGFNIIDQRVMTMCQTIREVLGVPVRVNSGCRCEKHNKAEGGVKGSKHLTGKAADLSCSKGAKVMFETVKRLYSEGKLPDLD